MINKVADHLQDISKSVKGNKEVKEKFTKRVSEGKFSRDENPESHYCVYFAAFDPHSREVFIGHHKKSGLWLFNGGHIDEREHPAEALEREIGEEWGNGITIDNAYVPKLLTITEINNPAKQKCRLHYDIWNFIPFNKDTFSPDKTLLETEFHQASWKTIEEAEKLITDPSTLQALKEIEKLFEKS